MASWTVTQSTHKTTLSTTGPDKEWNELMVEVRENPDEGHLLTITVMVPYEYEEAEIRARIEHDVADALERHQKQVHSSRLVGLSS